MMRYKLEGAVCKEKGMQENYEDEAAIGRAKTIINGKAYAVDFFAIADGVGSSKFSALAAQTAVSLMHKQIKAEMNKIKTGHVLTSSLERFIHSTNKKIIKKMKNLDGSGSTTIDAGIFFNRHLYLAHVGDNRAYVLRKTGELELITKDENLAWMDKTDGALLPSEQTKVHPTSKNLMNMLGRYDNFILKQMIIYPLEQAQAILIATDGLYKSVSDNKIKEKLQSISDTASRQVLEKALSELVNESMNPVEMKRIYVEVNGGSEEMAENRLKKDNRTVIIYQVGEKK